MASPRGRTPRVRRRHPRMPPARYRARHRREPGSHRCLGSHHTHHLPEASPSGPVTALKPAVARHFPGEILRVRRLRGYRAGRFRHARRRLPDSTEEDEDRQQPCQGSGQGDRLHRRIRKERRIGVATGTSTQAKEERAEFIPGGALPAQGIEPLRRGQQGGRSADRRLAHGVATPRSTGIHRPSIDPGRLTRPGPPPRFGGIPATLAHSTSLANS